MELSLSLFFSHDHIFLRCGSVHRAYHVIHLGEESKDESVQVQQVEGHDTSQLPLQLVPWVTCLQQPHQLRTY